MNAKMFRYSHKFFISFLVFFLVIIKANAQRDTTRRQTIEITSSYKPVLRNPVKINLYASPVTGDTSRPRLAYNIPPQNLFFTYQPVPLKPLALATDTALQLGDRNQLKLGFGSFTTPYVSGAFSFGDGKKNLANVYGDYISSRGKIRNQDFSEINIRGTGSLFTDKNETYAFAAFQQHEYYQYGYNHDLFDFDKGILRRSYQDFSAGIGFRNIAVNDLNIIYNPHLELHTFSRESKASETTLILNIPAEKKFSESVSLKVTASGNFDKYHLKNSTDHLTNNLFQLAPELVFYGDNFTFHGGGTPSWSNNDVTILPNVYGDYISSRGKIRNQDFSEINIRGTGSLFTDKNETYAFAAFQQHEYYQYGYNHDLFDFDKGILRRSYQDFSAGIGFRNIAVNDLNIIYNPHLELHTFSRESKASETTLILNIPAEKKFSESVSLKVTASGNFDKYHLKNSTDHLTNNLFQLAPELVFYGDNFTFHGGGTPSWSNNDVTILPNVYGEAQLQHNVLAIQAGWIGKYLSLIHI